METRILKISQNKIYVTPDYYFIFEETNLPTSNFAFKTVSDFYWEVEIVAFDKEAKRLTVQVSDYSPEDFLRFYEQSAKSHFDELHFINFQWQKLEPFLGLYRKSTLGLLIK